METGVYGFHLTLQRMHVLEIVQLMAANYNLGIFIFNKGPLNVAIALDNDIPHSVFIRVSLTLKYCKFIGDYLFWSQLIDILQEFGLLE